MKRNLRFPIQICVASLFVFIASFMIFGLVQKTFGDVATKAIETAKWLTLIPISTFLLGLGLIVYRIRP